MSRLRPLLRLDDKVAAERRRLQHIGGAPKRWVGPAALLAAAILHGAILLLPAMSVRATLPASIPAPDLPLVWRPIPPPSVPPRPPTARAAEPAPNRSSPVSTRAEVAVMAGPLATEPVPEPVPELALNTMPASLEAIVPDPDRPPPTLEIGPPSYVVPIAPPEAEPTLIERVPPVYPVAARSLRAEGRVTLRLTILPDGRVGEASVETCSRQGLGFETAALDAVKRWRYEPVRLTSGPRKVTVTVQFRQQDERR